MSNEIQIPTLFYSMTGSASYSDTQMLSQCCYTLIFLLPSSPLNLPYFQHYYVALFLVSLVFFLTGNCLPRSKDYTQVHFQGIN